MSEPNRQYHQALSANRKLLDEVARLKAEVAYLKGEEHPYADLGSMMPKYLLEHWVKENARLQADLERLRKAGDAMAKVIPDIMDYRFDGNECDKELKAWNAAKEGKPSV